MLLIAAVTRTERHAALVAVNDAINAAGGWVEGHSFFGNVAATIRLVMPRRGFAALAASLAAAGVTLDTDSRAKLAGLPDDATEVAAALAVTFIHDEPDLRREVPPFDL